MAARENFQQFVDHSADKTSEFYTKLSEKISEGTLRGVEILSAPIAVLMPQPAVVRATTRKNTLPTSRL